MKCPKCEEGVITQFLLKKSGRTAFICDFCETLWEEGERIAATTGHMLDSYEEKEFTIEPAEDTDQEHLSSEYKKIR